MSWAGRQPPGGGGTGGQGVRPEEETLRELAPQGHLGEREGDTSMDSGMESAPPPHRIPQCPALTAKGEPHAETPTLLPAPQRP